MARVVIPRFLESCAGGNTVPHPKGENVKEVLLSLAEQFPALQDKLVGLMPGG